MKNITLFAVAAGRETTESTSKVHRGVATVSLVDINPNKEELGKIFNTDIEKDPEYIYPKDDGTTSIRINLVMKTLPDLSNGIESIKSVNYFISNKPRTGKNGTKVQVINAYGDTAWLTKEEFEAKNAPSYNPEYCTKGMRVAFTGEEEITMFIKKFMNIPNYSFLKADGERAIHDKPELCECQLSEIPKYFQGNISELKSALMSRKDNKIKLLFGAKVTDDNKIYQDVFARYPMHPNTRNYSRLTKNIEDSAAAGAFPNTDFGSDPYEFKEYVLTPSAGPTITNSEAPVSWGIDSVFTAPSDTDLPL